MGMTDSNDDPKPGVETETREVRHEYSRNWGPILRHLRASLLVSTYQAGKLVVVSPSRDREAVALSYRNFEKAMGIAVAPRTIAVGSKSQIWTLRDAPDIAARIEPPGSCDACYLARSAHVTGEVAVHEMAYSGEVLWFINTLFSCVCSMDPRFSFAPRWKPPFITEFAPEDRCHLNGMAMVDGRPRYVTAMSQTDVQGGWRPEKATSGIVMDIATNRVVARGFAMPHSPRVHSGALWVLDSGTGRLVRVDLESGEVQPVVSLPGYTRGLAISGSLAFVGLSKIRETSTFGGVPIADRRESLRCGVAVVDLSSSSQIAFLEFHSGVEEIFDVQLLPGVLSPVVQGPYPHLDDTPPIWLAAPPRGLDSPP